MIDSSSQMILLATEGYLELGMLDDARLEYDRLSVEVKRSAEGLSLLIEIHRADGNFADLKPLAERLCVIDSDNVDRWIDLALMLSEEAMLENARELLREALDRFPDTALVHFHLARFECIWGTSLLPQSTFAGPKSSAPCAACWLSPTKQIFYQSGPTTPRQS
jgi:tetratricopeptide (TPR) repeat protein